MKNIWAKTKFYCGNHDDEINVAPMELVPYGTNYVYKCNEDNCDFKISTYDVEKIIMMLEKQIESSPVNMNITGYRFTYKDFNVHVYLYTNDEIKVNIKKRVRK